MMTPLQMMPSGMMPSGWDWGSMWLVMLLPALVLVAVIVVVVVLLLRREDRPNTAQTPTYSPLPYQPSTSTRSAFVQTQPQKPSNEAVGKVVLSLAPTLTDDERRVMDELAKVGGEMLQSDLPEKTGYSKATVSKAIHGLETRGIVVRERHRWTYWCKVNPRLVERVQVESS